MTEGILMSIGALVVAVAVFLFNRTRNRGESSGGGGKPADPSKPSDL